MYFVWSSRLEIGTTRHQLQQAFHICHHQIRIELYKLHLFTASLFCCFTRLGHRGDNIRRTQVAIVGLASSNSQQLLSLKSRFPCHEALSKSNMPRDVKQMLKRYFESRDSISWTDQVVSAFQPQKDQFHRSLIYLDCGAARSSLVYILQISNAKQPCIRLQRAETSFVAHLEAIVREPPHCSLSLKSWRFSW